MINILKSKAAAYISLSCITISLFFASCKRETTIVDPPAPCTAAIYGFLFTDSQLVMPTIPSNWGAIDPLTLHSTPTAAATLSAYSNQPAYNTVDNCYYMFQYINSGYANKLIKIAPTGAVSTYTVASTQFLEGLVYNPLTNKLYCLSYAAGSPVNVVEIATSGTAFTITPVATAASTITSSSPATSTVNTATGVIYFNLTTHSPTRYSIEKYLPGSTTTSVVATDTGKHMLGLNYNINDNQLYAIASETATALNVFTKIDPTSGAVTPLAPLPFRVNFEFYSTVLNPCTNTYLLSTLTGPGWATKLVSQLNMSGTIVQSDTTAGYYHGLVIKP